MTNKEAIKNYILSTNKNFLFLEEIIKNCEVIQNQIYKVIDDLKKENFVISVKKNLFYINKDNFDQTTISEIIEKNLFYILRLHLKIYNKDFCFITGIKALEVNVLGVDKAKHGIFEELYLVNNSGNSKETLINTEDKKIKIFFKQYKTSMSKYKNFLGRIKLNNNKTLYFSSVELSILESLLNWKNISKNKKMYIQTLISEAIYNNMINLQKIEEIIYNLGKYYGSLKLLSEISYNKDLNFYKKTLKLMKKNKIH